MLTWTKTSDDEQRAGTASGAQFTVCRTQHIRLWTAMRNNSSLRDASGRVRYFPTIGEAKAACEDAACLQQREESER